MSLEIRVSVCCLQVKSEIGDEYLNTTFYLVTDAYFTVALNLKDLVNICLLNLYYMLFLRYKKEEDTMMIYSLSQIREYCEIYSYRHTRSSKNHKQLARAYPCKWGNGYICALSYSNTFSQNIVTNILF